MHNYKQILEKIRKYPLRKHYALGVLLIVVASLISLASATKAVPLVKQWVSKNTSVSEKTAMQLETVSTTPTIALTPTPIATPTPTPTPLPTAIPTPTTPPVNNVAPGNGYNYQYVQTSSGTFGVALIAGDLNSTRVVVDTASDGDCSNDCPVLPVGTYAARSGAYAAINGSFFCPTEYPQCAGKTNSFDTLLMNKNKTYFNSANNVYSTVPLLYVSGTSVGVRGQTLDWGRDTGVDAVIANHPLYVSGGNNVFGGSSDAKINNKGTRTFIGNKGSTAYIGIIYNASAADAAAVLTTLHFDNALGLDQGGSTALWYNGSYVAGPGRNVPNAVLFLRK